LHTLNSPYTFGRITPPSYLTYQIANSIGSNPFGLPDWPCLNAICPEYKRNVIKEITIRSCEKTKKPIGRFTCPTCGFSYTRKGKDKDRDDRYKYTRIMDFGFLWKKELLSLLGCGLSYRGIARRLGVDTNTVIKYERVINTKVDSKKKVYKYNDLVNRLKATPNLINLEFIVLRGI
jgi:transposase-like protein